MNTLERWLVKIMNSKATFKSSSARKLYDNNQEEYKIHTGWKQEWVSPKHLNGTRPIKIREVVRGPFYSPKLIKISPFVNFISYCDEADRTTGYKKNTYGGIPDPWTECLAIKGYCNEKQAGALRQSCVSRCMRFWITKRVWKEMGLPLIQGIPDPGRDHFDDEKTYKRSSVKYQKHDTFDPMPQSKSLPDSLEKLFSQKSLPASSVVQHTGLKDKNRNNEKRLTTEGTKSSLKQLKVSIEEKKTLENNKNQNEHHRSTKSNNSHVRKSGGGGGNNDSLSNKRDRKRNHNFNSNQSNNAKPNEKTDRVHDRVHDHAPPLDTATQTSVHRLHCVPCQDSSFQRLLKMAKESIAPRKTYNALKEKWIRAKDSYIIENKKRYFSGIKTCRCKRGNNFPMATEKEKFDGYPGNSANNYCARCKMYLLKNRTFDCRCHGPMHGRWRDIVRDDEEKWRQASNNLVLKKNLENATTQTDLERLKELKLICSRCNYPYLKTEMKNEQNEPTMDYLFKRKRHSIVKNTKDEATHHFQGKNTEDKSTVVGASSLQSTTKRNDLKFACDATENGCYKDGRDMKNVEADEEHKIRRNVKETDADTKEVKETNDVERAKEKNLNMGHNSSVKREEFALLNNDVHTDIPELSKLDHFSDHSSVTSDTYLDRLNTSQLTSKKPKTPNAIKSKRISTDHSVKKSSLPSPLSYERKVSLKPGSEKNKNVVGFNEQINKKNKKKDEDLIDRADVSKERSRAKTKSKLNPKREATSKSPVERNSNPRLKSTINKSKPNNNFNSKNKSSSQRQSLSNPTSRSKSNSRPQSKSRSTSRSKSRPQSKSRSTSRSKSRPQSKSPSTSRSKSRPQSKSPSTSRSKSRPQSKSPSTSRSKSRPQSKSRSTSRSKSRSKSRSRSEPESKSKQIQTESELQTSKSLGDLPIAGKAGHSNINYFDVGSSNFSENIEQENSTRTESKDVSTSVTGYVFEPGPCFNRNYNDKEATYNDTVDSDESLYSSTRNFYKTVPSESKKFPSEATIAEDSVVAPKRKNCWLSKSDNYMNSPEPERENRINNLTSKKGNECYLRFCNSRFCSSVQSLTDESSKQERLEH